MLSSLIEALCQDDVKWLAPGCSISNEGVLAGSEAPGRYIVEAHAGGLKAEAPVRVLTAEEPPPPPQPAGKLKWTGVVPPRKWTTFYTKVIAKLTSSPEVAGHYRSSRWQSNDQ